MTSRLALAAAIALGCNGPGPVGPSQPALSADDTAMIDELEHRTFDWFWTTADPVTGLIPDRAPTPSFSSIAAVGFGLTAYAIGAERGWVSRGDARDRVIKTLTFFRDAPQGDAATGVTGYKGFYYHFLDMHTGQRYRDVELSSVDTALLLAGAMFCREYFAGSDAAETELRQIADTLLERVDWTWMQPRAPAISMGWQPEHGFLAYDWLGYNEGMLVQLLALGSPSHPVAPATWTAWQVNYDKTWGTAYGQTLLGFPPMFGHQYSHLWIDFRGIRDRYMAARGLDYFENSRRATLAQRQYAIANPDGWTGYSADVWGLTACDGPGDMTKTIAGKPRTIRGYAARGMASYDDGTIAPTAMIGSIAFAPEVVIPGIRAMKQQYGGKIYREHGFIDAFNPTLDWVDGDYLGIDQGPIIGMIENLRSELVWATMRKSAYLQRALRRAGFAEAGSRAALDPRLALALVLCAACGRDDGEPVTLRFWAMGTEGEFTATLMADFERAHPGIHVEMQQLPWSSAHEKLLTAYVGNATPDLAQLGNSWIPELAALDALAPLDTQVAASTGVPRDDYFAGIWATNEVDGHVFGIPWYVDTRLIFYRRDAFAGDPPTRWDAWLDALRAAKRATGHYAILLPLDEFDQLLSLALETGDPLIRDGRWGNFHGAGFRRALTFYLQLFVEQLAPVATQVQISNPWEEMQRGYFSSMLHGPWSVGEFRRRWPKDQQAAWATAVLPGPEGQLSGLAGGSSLVVFRRSEHPREAWQLIEYLSRPDIQRKMYELTGDLPPRRTSWADPLLAGDPQIQAFRQQLEHVRRMPPLPEWERIVTEMRILSERAVRQTSPRTTPAQLAAIVDATVLELDRRVDQMLEKRRWILDRRGQP